MNRLAHKSRKSPTALIVGAGLMGRFHAKAAQRGGADVVAVVDPDLVAAARIADRIPRAVPTTSLVQALARFAPAVVHVCTPRETHRAIAELVAKAGAHALIEKPLATSEQETRHILSYFSKAQRIVCPVHQYAFQNGMDLAERKARASGPIRRIVFDIRSAGGKQSPTCHDITAADILPHPLSMLQRLIPGVDLGNVDWHVVRPSAGEWLISAAIGSAAVVIGISLAGRPTRFATTIIHDGGTITLDNFHGFGTSLPSRTTRAYKIAQPFDRGLRELGTASLNLVGRMSRGELGYPGLRTLVNRFYAATATQSPASGPIGCADIIAIARASDRIVAAVHVLSGVAPCPQ